MPCSRSSTAMINVNGIASGISPAILLELVNMREASKYRLESISPLCLKDSILMPEHRVSENIKESVRQPI